MKGERHRFSSVLSL